MVGADKIWRGSPWSLLPDGQGAGWRRCSIRGCAAWGSGNGEDRAPQAINLVAMFNLTTGYFLSQRALDSLGGGRVEDPDNIARQKRLLRKVTRAMLIS